jgi:4-hydroxybenzoate polyprenyltransferase
MSSRADTIYACQDKRDDVQAGVKSTALLFGGHVKRILAVFATSLVTCLAVVGALNNQGIPYFILTVGGAAVHLTMQLRNLDVDDPKSCLDAVRYSCSHILAGCTNYDSSSPMGSL